MESDFDMLKAIILVNGFVLFLCLVQALSAKLLKQSGTKKLTINDQAPIEVNCGDTLYEALSKNSIYLPAACGGRGTCGKCALKVKGGGFVLPLEIVYFTPEELKAGMRLSCQLKVRDNLKVTIPEHLLQAESFVGTVSEIIQLSSDIKRFIISTGAKKLNFKPGQYIQLTLEQPWERVIRAYSISSAQTQGQFSLDVQLISGGIMSGWLHSLKEGQALNITGPYGEMCFEEKETKDIVLIAGGVGFAPMKAILETIVQSNFKNKVYCFWGARSANDLYDHKWLQNLCKEKENMNYYPALSRPLIEDGWTGETGFIHELVKKELPDNFSGKAFICGPARMMEACEKVLSAKGMKDDNIFKDPFDFS